MFSNDFDDKIVMKKIRGVVRDNPPGEAAKIPDGALALIQSEDLKFLAGINHNTPFIFLHHINIMHDMLIVCKELHWTWLEICFVGSAVKTSFNITLNVE